MCCSTKSIAMFCFLGLPRSRHRVCDAQSYDQWIGQTFGRTLSCHSGQAMVGACGAAEHDTCVLNGQTFHHLSQCVRQPSHSFGWHEANAKTKTIGTRWGDWAYCPDDYFAIARCGSGKNADCHFEGSNYWQTLTCAQATPDRVKLIKTDVKTVCAPWGRADKCPKGYVVTGACGSGGDSACGTDRCSGITFDVVIDSPFGDIPATVGVTWGLRCTRVSGYEYIDVENPTIGAPTSYEFDGVCRAETFHFEGQSGRTISESERFSSKSSFATRVTRSQTSGRSLTETLRVTREIGAAVGFPKIGLTVSATTSTERGLERVTTFDKTESYYEELISEKERYDEVNWQYELAGDLTWTIASWNARVTAAGDYEVLYNEWSPGNTSPRIVSEDVTIVTNRLDDRSFTLVLNSANHASAFLRSPCSRIATEYVLGIGEFSYLTPDTQVEELIEYAPTNTPTSVPTNTSTGAPSSLPTSGVNSSNRLRGENPDATTSSFGSPLLGTTLTMALIVCVFAFLVCM